MDLGKKNTKEKIIKASFRVLEREGLSGTTTRKIADEAGVSEVTIFRKFKTKDKLLDESKEYYTNYFIEKLEKIFTFDENTSLEDYLESIFNFLVNLPKDDLNLIKIAMYELQDIPFEKKVLSKLSHMIISRLSEFFRLKIKQKEIRNINPDILALNVFSIIFESTMLWKIYGRTPKEDVNKYFQDFLDILLHGIK